MHAYYSHYRSFCSAFEYLDTAERHEETLQINEPATHCVANAPQELLLLTEEVYAEGDDRQLSHGVRHHFTLRSVEPSEVPDLLSQGVLFLTAGHWTTLNVADMTYYDYFLAFNEQPYITFVNFLARLHIITSPSYVTVAPDGRLFAADIFAIIHSASDSLLDTPAADRLKVLSDCAERFSEITKQMEPVVVRGPRNTKVTTYLTTLALLRQLMLSIETECRRGTDPKLEYNWAVRIRNYMLTTFPGVCKAATDHAIEICGSDRRQGNENSRAGEEQGRSTDSHSVDKANIPVRLSGQSIKSLSLPRKHFMFSDTTTPNLKDECDPGGYEICSIRVSIGAERCGFGGPWELYGTDRHEVGFDCTIRAKGLTYSELLQSNIRHLFNAQLIDLELGRDVAQPLLRTASLIAFSLRELALLHDSNFDNEKLSIRNLCRYSYSVWQLFLKACGHMPLRELHEFLMCPRDQNTSYKQDAEVTISKIAALSIACCAAAVFFAARQSQGKRSSVFRHSAILKNSLLNFAEASMVVNIVLKATMDAGYPLLTAVLSVPGERILCPSLPVLRDAMHHHPLIFYCFPNSINERSRLPCGCVVCTDP
jgi:hypothetical protein